MHNAVSQSEVQNQENRVICLYRVSTLDQVDKLKNDIPMQREACHEYIAAHGWRFTDELSEKGVSGFKVSANDRDAIQILKSKAIRHEFDILLVFMFDRLGRIESETPFIVEWFVKQGIRVWSVKEGEQRFESHVDKLTNYIRFWQAAGESEKTSIRIRTRLEQIAQEGHYHGGSPAYGYESVHLGRLNKHGFPVKDLRINEEEANVVRLVFDLYVNQGMGTHTIGNHLYHLGILNHSGGIFTNTTIRHMLGRITYTGRIKCGEVLTEPIPELRIIRGESKLPESVLTEMLNVAEKQVYATTTRYREACEQAKSTDALCEEMTRQLTQLKDWSVLYDSAEPPVKKMIASELIERVSVGVGYKLDIKLRLSYEQFMGMDTQDGALAFPLSEAS